MSKKKLVILTGAGMSAESGITTFREANGLWAEYKIEDVATPEAFAKKPELVLEFYNRRRAQLDNVEPNKGHKVIAELQDKYDVQVITQNVDNLHERAGNEKVLHLHGELTKVRSNWYPELIYDIGTKPIKLGDTCNKGAQLRPHIVWFGEPVPAMDEAISLVSEADIFIVIGTSLNVYPAAGLIRYVGKETPKYLIDPNDIDVPEDIKFNVIKKPASEGMTELNKTVLK